jgi:hypothetical protein
MSEVKVAFGEAAGTTRNTWAGSQQAGANESKLRERRKGDGLSSQEKAELASDLTKMVESFVELELKKCIEEIAASLYVNLESDFDGIFDVGEDSLYDMIWEVWSAEQAVDNVVSTLIKDHLKRKRT